MFAAVSSLIGRFAVTTLKQARRLIVFVFGVTLLVVGVALIFLPGPAFVVIPLALVILASEFVWARRLLRRFKDEVKGWRRFFS